MKTFSLFLPANTTFFLALLLVPIEFISYIAKPMCEVTRAYKVQGRVFFSLRTIVFTFMFYKDYVKRSNNIYSTVSRIGTISLTPFAGSHSS